MYLHLGHETEEFQIIIHVANGTYRKMAFLCSCCSDLAQIFLDINSCCDVTSVRCRQVLQPSLEHARDDNTPCESRFPPPVTTITRLFCIALPEDTLGVFCCH